ncbi:sensor histidine kinase [Alsobacter metallidurans]|uniref:sensor histidine kinase n=1 Tax=Alsobacter metallidurans TaxID=340221 RepID=UPI00166EB592|nr:sensor histidine kinase [Alsobacter metallidurans]
MQTQWRSLTLVRQFILVNLAVTLLGMLALGAWVTRTIEAGVIHASTASAAVYMNSVIAPHLLGYTANGILSDIDRRNLDAAKETAGAQRGVVALKIWAPGGRILYSSHHEAEGQVFVETGPLAAAFKGQLSWEFDDLDDPESVFERQLGMPLLEIYAPVHDSAGRVMAVAEFYENAEAIDAETRAARISTWLMTAGAALFMMWALFWIVARGSRLIEEQRTDLRARVSQLSTLLQDNEKLRGDRQRAARRAAEDNERLLNRLGSDLHDGPAQLISLALLRLKPQDQDVKSIQNVLKDALNEVRNVCSGLMMPEIRDLPPADAFRFIVDAHQRRTGTAVDFSITGVPTEMPAFLKTCLCRIVQEGLSNAYRHADGAGQRVLIAADEGHVTVVVEDDGPGISDEDAVRAGSRLGLAGIRQRVDSLGGSLTVGRIGTRGTRLTAVMPLEGEAEA